MTASDDHDAEPREREASPSNFVDVGQVMEKVANLHGRLIGVLSGLVDETSSERERMLLESWIADEQRLAVTLGERIEELDGGAPEPGATSGYDTVVQYARLDAFEEAVADLEKARDDEPRLAIERAEHASERLVEALRQLAERVEHSDAQDTFRSLADLEEGNARRRSDDENASLTL